MRKELLVYIVIFFLMNILDSAKFSAELDIQLQVIWMLFQAPELVCSNILCVAPASFLMRVAQQQVAQTNFMLLIILGFEGSTVGFHCGKDADLLIESTLVLQTKLDKLLI